MKNKETAVNKEIETLNEVLNAAIEHGGDAGGPYFCNKEELQESIMRYLTVRGLNDEYIVINTDHWPKIVKKEN